MCEQDGLTSNNFISHGVEIGAIGEPLGYLRSIHNGEFEEVCHHVPNKHIMTYS